MTEKSDLLIWALIDDRAGNKSQCLGVAEALGLAFQTRALEYAAAAALPNIALGATFKGLSESARLALAPPWPDMVISAGRRTAPVARNIKKLNGGKTFLAQIMYPGDLGVGDFGLIAAPSHDPLRERPNLMTITGAPHQATAAALEKAAGEWRAAFKDLPRPWTALMVGGSTKRRVFTKEMARELGRIANMRAKMLEGSLLVSTSRRSEDAAEALFAEITRPSHIYKWGDEGGNPYLGYLALADAVIVTGDSVSMCSEACATTGPVYIFAPKKLTVAKHGHLHRELYELGHARPLDGTFTAWKHPPLNAALAIAAEIRARMGI